MRSTVPGVLVTATAAMALLGCSTISMPLAVGLEPGKPSEQSWAATETAAGETNTVAPESSAKAPKGALADRDYSGAALDANRALALINDYRKANGLGPLKLDARLTAAAKMHSKDLARGDRISHYGSDGSSLSDRVKRAGYDAAVAAENIGTGQASLDEVVTGWKGSEGHNRNLLLPDVKDLGIALVQDPKTEFKTFWTMVVGAAL